MSFVFCFYLGSQACRKPVVFSSNPGEIPSILPAALGALSSPRRPMLLRALKESIAQFHGGGFDLCPVSFSFHFPLLPLSSLVSEAASQGPFRHLQSGSRLLAELGVSSCYEYGKAFWTCYLGNLGVWVSLIFWLLYWCSSSFSLSLHSPSTHIKLFFHASKSHPLVLC